MAGDSSLLTDHLGLAVDQYGVAEERSSQIFPRTC